MSRYFTIMLVPDREEKIRSFRIPQVIFHSFLVIGVALLILISVLTYDYINIAKQVYINKHITIENRQLKEQLHLFNTQIGSLGRDLERINIFERKLRFIIGLDHNFDRSPSSTNTSILDRPEKKKLIN